MGWPCCLRARRRAAIVKREREVLSDSVGEFGWQVQHVLGRAEMGQDPCGTGEVSVFGAVGIEDADSFGADQDFGFIGGNSRASEVVAGSNGVLFARQQGDEFVYALTTKLINVDLDLHEDLRTPGTLLARCAATTAVTTTLAADAETAEARVLCQNVRPHLNRYREGLSTCPLPYPHLGCSVGPVSLGRSNQVDEPRRPERT